MRSNEVMIHGFCAPSCLSVCLPARLSVSPLFIYSVAVLDLHGGKQSNSRSEDRDRTAAHEADVGLFMFALWGILHGPSHTIIIITSTAFCFQKPCCLFPRFSAALYLPSVLADTFPSQRLQVSVLCVQSQLTWRGLDRQQRVKVTLIWCLSINRILHLSILNLSIKNLIREASDTHKKHNW